MYVKEHQCVMSSFKEQLTNERLQILDPLGWARAKREVASNALSYGKLICVPREDAVVRSVYKASKKKREKDYTSDSSGTERETDGKIEGRIYRMPKGSGKDYYVYYKGKKITFGDSSMPNKNNDDERRANFNARHNCDSKTDKTKAGYWACKVWKKGYRGPDSKKD